MKISYNWIKRYVNTDIDAHKAAELLTGCGLEVEAIEEFESVKGSLNGLVVGNILSVEQHPKSSKLTIVKVDVGEENPLNIVCGAPNVKPEQHVVVAKIGTRIYPINDESYVIKKTKIRGIESEGMLCAEDEIGLGTSHHCIIILDSTSVVGSAAADYFNIEKDSVFEIGLTPNRGDATSHLGVARDLAAVLRVRKDRDNDKIVEFRYPPINEFRSNSEDPYISVDMQDIDACWRYSSLCISNVNIKESPDWLKNKLNAIGVRPINNIVDVTQFVLFSLGNPLHAFDADKIAGKTVIIKKPEAECEFVTLDGVKRKISVNDLMICDSEKPMCMAGVLGGEYSGVSEKTVNIFLESAYFEPTGIRKTAKYHGLKTDASFRFERGCDPNATVYALKVAAMLIQKLAGGEISEVSDFYPRRVFRKELVIDYDYLRKFIGKFVPRTTMRRVIMESGITIINYNNNNMRVSIPTSKPDVTRQADVIEEFLRIYGYDKIAPTPKFNYNMSVLEKNPLIDMQEIISDYLSNNGFYQTMNNSLTKAEYAENFKFINSENTVTLLNPLSRELQNMRQTLLFSALENVILNINHGTTDIKIYEFGTIYSKNNEAKSDDIRKKFFEQNRLSICVTGKIQSESWQIKQSDVDFYYLKNMIENAMQRLNVNFSDLKTENHQTQDAMDKVLVYFYQNAPFITIGKVNEDVLKYFDIQQPVFYGEIDCDILKTIPLQKTIYVDLNKFPEVSRDLALLVDKKITYKEIEDLAFKTEQKYLKSVNLFDVYQGSNIGEDKKSYAVRFILYNTEKTLTNDEINGIMDKFVSVFEDKLGAKLR